MIIQGVEIVDEEGGACDLVLSGDAVAHIEAAGHFPPAPPASTVPTLAFRDAIAFPGLTNSHDHLEFNLYPRLGHRHYADYVEWGEDIHRQDAELIASIEAVPRTYRLRWGAVKNLLCGVTTVGHHGDPARGLPLGLLGGKSIHSIRVDPKWRWRLNAPVNRAPYVFHIGEGTSPACHGEIDRLIRWNLFGRDLIGVHGVAMDAGQATQFRGVVWCPLSNQFLYGRTADIRSLKERTAVLFGTDSTLTADWNLWNHLRAARALGVLTDRELFDAVTRSAAQVWGRPQAGRLAAGSVADLVVARKKAPNRWDAFFAVDPEDILLIVRGGVPLLIDGSIELAPLSQNGFPIRIGGRLKIVAEDVPELLRNIRQRGLEPNIPLGAA